MREAVIVATARTPLTRSFRGEFNITPGPALAAHAVRAWLVTCCSKDGAAGRSMRW
ncbi:hypothetical protein AB4Z48_34250 [Cupriavidus sp. 2TAF22]|uniref:hypothetical protein n=1 Tax=unclassified Cupriavidus TaxID=2640874 RepID=UPI003F912412